jgi:hypothetical protein
VISNHRYLTAIRISTHIALYTPEISEHSTQPHAGCNYSKIYILFQFVKNCDEYCSDSSSAEQTGKTEKTSQRKKERKKERKKKCYVSGNPNHNSVWCSQYGTHLF